MRRRLLALCVVALLSDISAAAAQGGTRVPYLVYLVPGSSECGMTAAGEAFRQALSESGYVSGRDVRWDRRCYQTEEALSDAIGQLVRQAPDVIFVTGTPAALAAKRATTTIPIVFAGVADPVALGLVRSLANPGANITGVTNAHPDVTRKRLQLLKEAVPGITRVAVLIDPAIDGISAIWRDAREAAHPLALDAVRIDARSTDEIDAAFDRARREHVGGIVIVGSNTFWVERYKIARLAIRNRLPTISSFPIASEAGVLLSYGVTDTEMFRMSGRLVGKILKGAKPQHVPVEAPTKFEFAVNLRTARALGLSVPPSVLVRADHVVE